MIISPVVVPPRRLAGFARLTLAAGQSQTVRVSFPVTDLAVTPGDIDSTARRAVETGAYQVVVDGLPAASFTIS